MIITKFLFKEYGVFPKLAWWHENDEDVYYSVLEKIYADVEYKVDCLEFESIVLTLFDKADIVKPPTIDWEEGWEGRYASQSLENVKKKYKVLNQHSFLHDGLFGGCDLLILNDEGKYDLCEVKSKSNIRKERKNKTAGPLLPELAADLGFQAYVLSHALGDKFSGKSFIYYVNKEYIEKGDRDWAQLTKKEEVTSEIMPPEEVIAICHRMQSEIGLSQKEFDKIHPFTGTKYFEHFGEEPVPGSIWRIPNINSRLIDMYHQGLQMIVDMSPADIELLTDKQRRFVKNWQRGQTVIDRDAIREKLASLERPLYFYDYETISCPIPILENTHGNQLVVVQYSLHIMDENDVITAHHEYMLKSDRDYKSVIAHLLSHIDTKKGTFIVWYQHFENTRNKEMAAMFPEYAERLLDMNARTFDLMDIFRDQLYFDRDFNGYTSIKKVLPVLTDLSYDGLEVSNGQEASYILLQKINLCVTLESGEEWQRDLLEYCKMDTLAMVRIYERLVREVNG